MDKGTAYPLFETIDGSVMADRIEAKWTPERDEHVEKSRQASRASRRPDAQDPDHPFRIDAVDQRQRPDDENPPPLIP